MPVCRESQSHIQIWITQYDIINITHWSLNSKASKDIMATYINSTKLKQYTQACPYSLRIITYSNNLNVKTIQT